ncbi:MAG: hypothetical protein KKA79_01640 [Nanoarchaeota archaeon]|nr:hypothetical protein [Nanoarchaeota archaeon]MCG2718446.1 hypothetical protein [Nanoarchaeota archaeon]
MVKVEKSSEKLSKHDECYIKACDVLEDLVKKEKDDSLKFYRAMGSVYNDYPTCVKTVIEINVKKKFLKNPVVKLDIYNKDYFDLAYVVAKKIEKEQGFKVNLEKSYE